MITPEGIMGLFCAAIAVFIIMVVAPWPTDPKKPEDGGSWIPPDDDDFWDWRGDQDDQAQK